MMSDRDDRDDRDDLVVVRALLSASNPVADAPLNDIEQRRGEHLLALLLANSCAPPHRPRSRPGRGAFLRRRGVLTAAATVVVIAAALVGLTTVRTHDRATATPLLPDPLLTASSGDHDRAVAVLLDAARRQRDSAQVGAGPVLYARVQDYGLDVAVAGHTSTTTARTTITDVWRGSGGAVRTDQYVQQVDRAGTDIGGPTPDYDDQVERRPDHPPLPPEADPALTPTDPAQILARLKAHATAAGYPVDLTVAADVLSTLRTGLTSPAQNAALYEVLAQISGVFDLGRTSDHAGRPGRAVGVVVSDKSSFALAVEYVILSDAGAPLTIETVETPPPPGLHLPHVPTVGSYTEIITARRVPTVGTTM